MSDARFTDDVYTIRKKFLTFTGQSFHVYDEQENLIYFCRQKGFKLKEDIRLYNDEQKSQERLTLQARQIIDWGATYDVVDPVANESVGSLRRRGMKSLIRDEWTLFDTDGREIGRVYEDSQVLAVIRRLHELLAAVTPQSFHVEVDGRQVCTMKQNLNPFIHRLRVDYSFDPERTFDRRLGLAAAVLMCAIEGRQS